jgi:hypothetical protein
VVIFMGFIHGALVNEPHRMGFLDSTGTARVAGYREEGRANSAPKAQSIFGESHRLELEIGKLRNSARAAWQGHDSLRRAGFLRC